MNYPLYQLKSYREFEDVVVSICSIILGEGTKVFAHSHDGGRDAEFIGVANCYPSKTSPWDGRIIIQAKHTENPIASCSDPSFEKILEGEIRKHINSLKRKNKIDYYMLFTNRKMTGVQDLKIEDLLNRSIGVRNIIIGNEKIQRWLKDYPEVVKKNGLNRLNLPLQFYEEDLKDIILAFSKTPIPKNLIDNVQNSISRIGIEEKNRLNNLTKVYFDNVFKKSYNEFQKIEGFLQDPRNDLFKGYYLNTVADLQAKIIAQRSDFITYDEIFGYIGEYVFTNNVHELRDHRRFIRTFLHYMYFNCEIGIQK